MEISEMKSETVPWLKTTNNAASNTTEFNKDILGKDDFFKLLITQLKYQDPMEPVKDKEFIAQMASFSSLEQMQNLNTGFQDLSKNINDFLIPNLLLQQSSEMIGREVSYVISEENESGEEEEVTMTGQVESVGIQGGIPYYVIDGQKVSLDSIISIDNANSNQNKETLDSILDKLEQISESLISGEDDTGE